MSPSGFDKWLQKEYLKQIEKEYLDHDEAISMDEEPIPPAATIIYLKKDFLRRKRKALLIEQPSIAKKAIKGRHKILKASFAEKNDEARKWLPLFKEYFGKYHPSPEFLSNDFSRMDNRHLKATIGREIKRVLKEREEANMIKSKAIAIPNAWPSKEGGIIRKEQILRPLDGARKEIVIHIFNGGYFDIENETIPSNIDPSSKSIYAIELNKKATLWEEQIKINLFPKTLRFIKWTIRDFEDVQNFLKKRSLNKRAEAHSCRILCPFLKSETVAIIGTGGTYYDLDKEWWDERRGGAAYAGRFTVKVNSKTFNWIKETLDHFHRIQEYLGKVLD